SSKNNRFLILGVWAERHHLELNQPQPFNGSAHPDAASRPSWRVVDVTEVSRIAEFDFLMDESHGLTKDTEYFVALSGCSSTQCRTAGFAKFTAWQQGGGKQNLVVIIAGSGAAVAVAACVIAVGVTLGIRFREYIYDVLNEGQSGQTSQQPADENPYDEAEPDSQSTVRMQNFDAVPNSAYGASRACGGGRQAATGSAANSAYMYMGAAGPSNSGGTLEYQRWQNGTEN
uniref:Fibronectin type-III domain-containing protein n=1 Tax=Macrostomum lignano TaxID=282301 RepID=A0A1I8I8D1_9PLAT